MSIFLQIDSVVSQGLDANFKSYSNIFSPFGRAGHNNKLLPIIDALGVKAEALQLFSRIATLKFDKGYF